MFEEVKAAAGLLVNFLRNFCDIESGSGEASG